MRIPTEAESDLREAKEAIQILKEYCESRGNCDNCDREIQEWCVKYIPPSTTEWNPSDWTVKK